MKKAIIFLIIGILILSGIGIYSVLFYENSAIRDFPLDIICTSTYLNFCYNQSNPAYGCNMETKTCDNEEFRLTTIIGFIQEQNIKIYGTTWCPACRKQLNEFGKYGDYLLQSRIFVYCDVMPLNPECINIEGVPIWKQNGRTIHIGYLNIQQIVLDTNNSDEIL